MYSRSVDAAHGCAASGGLTETERRKVAIYFLTTRLMRNFQ